MIPLSDNLLRWYSTHARALPWRDHPNPYAVWVAEIMLQQTRVETVIPYFERWMRRFSTVHDLAAASEQEVLTVWEGLGYYSRARNLHRAAQIVVCEHGGELPSDIPTLRRLPGIGRYTAGAIASIAYGLDEPTLDGNLRRVFARLFDVHEPADLSVGEKILWKLAAEHLPHGRAGDYNQAIMDLGATVCTPHAPDCAACPLSGLCLAYALGVREERPVLKPKPATPHHTVTAAIIERDGKYLLARRPQKGLLGGLWEFPGGKVEAGESLESALHREIHAELGMAIRVGAPFGIYRHAYTHFRFTLHAFLCYPNGDEPRALEAGELSWVSPSELSAYPMGKVDRQIARRLATDTLTGTRKNR
ncbi:MAG: A/G-specific adenine glycosylase [Anaerolineales bacterium]|nr:A/G-specific adenine glycosylase [Anaerolineales bacterium]